MKRGLVISDLHCGHYAGLTPPRWQAKGDGYLARIANAQKQQWNWYLKTVSRNGPYDWVLVNGDAIDGKGSRSGSAEQWSTQPNVQVEAAIYAIRKALTPKKTKLIMTYGTPYHVGPEGEDFEADIARVLNGKIGGHEWIDSDKVIFDCKHKISSSSVPHGRHTAASREDTWNAMWAERSIVPRADVLIRSHVHYFKFGGDANRLYLTTPALQGMGSRYGVRQCSGVVDFGVLIFETQRGSYTWHHQLAELKHAAVKPVKV